MKPIHKLHIRDLKLTTSLASQILAFSPKDHTVMSASIRFASVQRAAYQAREKTNKTAPKRELETVS